VEAPDAADGPRLSAATSVLNPSLAGIRGWLILPAISLVLTGISGVAAVLLIPVLFVQAAGPRPAWELAIAWIMNTALFALWLATALRFFGKRRSAPRWMIGLILAQLAATATGMILNAVMDIPRDPAREFIGLFHQIVAAAIWIPYFLVSTRVAMTFRK